MWEGLRPPPRMCLCLSAETMSPRSVLSPPALMNSHPVLTVYSPPAACSLPLSQPCSLQTHLLWLMTCSAKSFLKQTTLFLNLAEVSFYQRSHQLLTRHKHADWGIKAKVSFKLFFLLFFFRFNQTLWMNEWALCVAGCMLCFDHLSRLLLLRELIFYFLGACESLSTVL